MNNFIAKGKDAIYFIKKHYEISVLFVLLCIGAYLRLIGLDWDQAQMLHPDERFLTMVTGAIKFPKNSFDYFNTATSTLNPGNQNFGFFVYGTFPIFFTKALAEFFHYDRLQLFGRILSACFDLATIVTTYFIGKKLFSKHVGLIAASLLTASVLNIQLSHFYGMENFSSFFITICFLLLLTIYQPEQSVGVPSFFLSKINNFLFTIQQQFKVTTAQKDSVLPENDEGVLALNDVTLVKPVPLKLYTTQAFFSVLIGLSFGLALACKMNALFFGGIIAVAYLITFSRELIKTTTNQERIRKLVKYVLLSWLLAFGTYISFRLFQPYAFDSFSLMLNSKWISTMKEVTVQQSGLADFPPALQWVERPLFLYSFSNMLFWYMGIFFCIAATVGCIFYTIKTLISAWHLFKHYKNPSSFPKPIIELNHILPLLYVLSIFLYQASRFVQPGRYFNTIYPFLAIIAAGFLYELTTKIFSYVQKYFAQTPKKLSMFIAVLPVSIVLIGNFLWGYAFISIYTHTNSRVEASEWIFENVPSGSTISGESWDDPLPLRIQGRDPFGSTYKGIVLENFYQSTPEVLNKLVDSLEKVDVLVTSSNRVYGSIVRLPERYPATIAFYDKLFNGEAGFTLVKKVTSYPSLFGLKFNDDFADESFTVYDHPQVHIFKKNASFDAKALSAFLLSFPEPKMWPLTTAERNKKRLTETGAKSLLLSENILNANKNADTSAYFVLNDKSSALVDLGLISLPLSIFIWLLALEVLGLIVFPLVFMLFNNLEDRGFGVAKIFGLLVPAWLIWFGAHLQVLTFTLPSILGALISTLIITSAIANAFARARKQNLLQELRSFLVTSWKLLVLLEIIFLLAYGFFVYIRMQNPDLWQPWTGGEKIFENAFLSGITRSVLFPPADAWFSGGFINYYYFGLYLISFLAKTTGIALRVAVNLAIPTLFAFTVLATVSIVYTITLRVLSQPNENSSTDAS